MTISRTRVLYAVPALLAVLAQGCGEDDSGGTETALAAPTASDGTPSPSPSSDGPANTAQAPGQAAAPSQSASPSTLSPTATASASPAGVSSQPTAPSSPMPSATSMTPAGETQDPSDTDDAGSDDASDDDTSMDDDSDTTTDDGSGLTDDPSSDPTDDDPVDEDPDGDEEEPPMSMDDTVPAEPDPDDADPPDVGPSEPSPPDPGGGNVIQGQGGVVASTIVVRAGEIFDGGGLTFTAGGALGDGSQSENQQPVFRLEDGAQLRNVVLGAPAADGIHCYGDVELYDIVWQDIGEDALTIKESGTVVLDGGSAQNGDDKVFQINAPSTFIVRNFTAKNAGKFIRQNGDTTFKVDVVIENCDISQMDECIFRTDSSSSTVSMSNTRYSDLGDGLFVGVNASNITLSNNTEY